MIKNTAYAALATLLYLTSSTTIAGDAAAGKTRAAACAACHGLNGIGTQPIYPNLAGQKAEYITQTLVGFKSGDRKNAIMNAMAAPLSDSDIANLAAYYSSLKCQ